MTCYFIVVLTCITNKWLYIGNLLRFLGKSLSVSLSRILELFSNWCYKCYVPRKTVVFTNVRSSPTNCNIYFADISPESFPAFSISLIICTTDNNSIYIFDYWYFMTHFQGTHFKIIYFIKPGLSDLFIRKPLSLSRSNGWDIPVIFWWRMNVPLSLTR